jgi:zinc transport system substrate-binding protein
MIVMMFWRVLVLAVSTLSLVPVTGCGAATPAASCTLTITAAFYPFQFIAERVGGSLVSVTDLTPPGAEPHDLELSPKQVAGLGEADLVIYQSGFQPAVDAGIQTVPPKRSVDTANFLTLRPAAEQDAHENGAEGALDPHTWLAPTNMVTIAEHVRDALAAAAPSAASTFQANATSLISDLKALDADYREGLKGCPRQVFITSHEAFGYLAERYGLQQVGIRGIEPDTEPSAARIAEVQQIAREHGVTTIFFETLVSPAVAQSVAGDLGLVTDVLDPLEGLTAESRGGNYLEVMRSNLTALRKANGCS